MSKNVNREEKRNQISQEELENALRIAGLFLCNDYRLDCTNGMTLRTQDDVALTSGWNNVAKFFFLSKLERAQKELAVRRQMAKMFEFMGKYPANRF